MFQARSTIFLSPGNRTYESLDCIFRCNESEICYDSLHACAEYANKEARGRPVRCLGGRKHLCSNVDGYGLHAARIVAAHDRDDLDVLWTQLQLFASK